MEKENQETIHRKENNLKTNFFKKMISSVDKKTAVNDRKLNKFILHNVY